MKTCNRCLERKPLSEFHKETKMRDGYKNQCKACARRYRKKRKSRRYAGAKQLPYHQYQMQRLFAGERTPYGPGETMDLMRHQGFRCSAQDAALFKAAWVREDREINALVLQDNHGAQKLPPCHNCPATLLFFCATTGTFCKKFNQWAEHGGAIPYWAKVNK